MRYVRKTGQGGLQRDALNLLGRFFNYLGRFHELLLGQCFKILFLFCGLSIKPFFDQPWWL